MNKPLIRTLVIDDSAYSRRTIADILEASGEVQVVGIARDGEDGIKKALELKPDLITLDLEMPKMDGFTFLRILMKSMPTPVLVISTMNQRKTVFRAMEMGAVDFLAKPDPQISHDLYDIKEDLVLKVRVVGQLKMPNVQRRMRDTGPENEITPPPQQVKQVKSLDRGPYDCLVIGSSTGGPSALQVIFSTLPANLPFSIAASQHMPAGFTRAFAERLDKYSAWQVKEAQNGDVLRHGRALIAPGGYHMLLRRVADDVKVELIKRSPQDKYVPSVDKLFTSAGEAYGASVLGVVLTGMGNDGKEGVQAIKKAGGTVFAESEKTAIVYGMPKEAVATGAVDQSLPLESIAPRIAEVATPVNAGRTQLEESEKTPQS